MLIFVVLVLLISRGYVLYILRSQKIKPKPEIKFHNGILAHKPNLQFHIISICSTNASTLRIHYEYKLQASSIEISYEEAENSGIFNPDKFYEYINK